MCAMVCLLQENGRLGFDDKVQKHLPEFPYPDITVRQLMNHTSGVTEYFDLCVRYTGALDTMDNQAIMQLYRAGSEAARAGIPYQDCDEKQMGIEPAHHRRHAGRPCRGH